MRCATCGTDNEPDSRFCGNCGAKVTGSVAPGAFTTRPGPGSGRVAPTQKIPPGGVGPESMSTSSNRRNTPPSMPPPMGAQPASVQVPPPSMQARHVGPRPASTSAPPRTSSAPPLQPSGPVSVNATAVRPSAPQVQKPAPRPAASVAEASLGTSVPRKGRNWPLIVILFIIDLGLAAAGAIMLQRGLVRDDEVPTVKASKP